MQKYTTPRRRAHLTLARVRRRHLDRFGHLVAAGWRSEATLRMHRSNWRLLLRGLGQRRDARRIALPALERYVERELRGRRVLAGGRVRPIKPQTIAKRLSTLRGGLRVALRTGALRRLPEWPQLPARVDPIVNPLRSFEEYARIFWALPAHRAEWFAIAVWTGQRAADIERMTIADIDINARPPWVVVRSTKTRQAPIRVRAPRELALVFRRRFDREGRPPSGAPLVRRWTNRGYQLPSVCRRLGLEPLRALDLRHTFACWIAERQGTISPALQRLLGHRSSYCTSKYYVHASRRELDAAVKALEGVQRRRRRGSIPRDPGSIRRRIPGSLVAQTTKKKGEK
jgi:integrase